MCVLGFSSEKTRYGLLALSFYFIEKFYIEIAFFTKFPPFFIAYLSIFLLATHSKMFRVGAKT